MAFAPATSSSDSIDPTAPSASAVVPVNLPRSNRYQRLGYIPFVLLHVLVFGAFFTGVTRSAVIVCVALYWLRMFGATGGYHRYFSHRTYKTSRVFQFVLAWIAESGLQKGVLWWAAHHRRHHRFSDQPEDLHSPVQRGFWYAHIGWLFDGTDGTNLDAVRDLARFPELRWIDRWWIIPPATTAVLVTLLFGWSGFFIGACLSTVLLWHGCFSINSLAHVIGTRRYATSDDSRNHWALAVVTMGEGWHNNHHHYMASTRQGFRWWEVDATWYVLKLLSWVGIVWDLRPAPREDRPATAPLELPVPRELTSVDGA